MMANFNIETGKTYVYPTNFPIRDYQFNIVKIALYQNTLVCLPTGLGKTFIAAVLIYNFYRWFPTGKVVFMAPTRPLVTQQIEACHKIMGIPQTHTIEMTGSKSPETRAAIWRNRRVFFLTPQVLMNDLASGTCPLGLIKLVVVDEAHKALGDHSYCQVIKHLKQQHHDFRVLALSATPGSDIKAVEQVIINLMISHIELRNEESIDILPYVHNRELEKIVISIEGDLKSIIDQFYEILKSYVFKLIDQKLLFTKNERTLSKYQILLAREAFRKNPPFGMSRELRGMLEGTFAICASLYHASELLTMHGIKAFYNFLKDSEKSSTNFAMKLELKRNRNLIELLDLIKGRYFPPDGLEENPGRPLPVSHPKMDKLRQVILKHFQDYEAMKESTRVIVFSQYRDSVQEIKKMLMSSDALIKPMCFIGQSSTQNRGLTQKEQMRVVKEFKEGNYNTLIATCIGEEGLDIGEVDLIICYDAPKSPIRLVQRMGRTGRKRRGRIVILVTEGKEEKDYIQSQYQKRMLNNALTKGGKLTQFLYKQCPRIIPEGITPECLKLIMKVQEWKPDVGKKDYLPLKWSKQKERNVKRDEVLMSQAEQMEYEERFLLKKGDDTLKQIPPPLFIAKQKEPLGNLVQKNEIDLSSYQPWNSTLQPCFGISHSLRTQKLIHLTEFIGVQEALGENNNYEAELAPFFDNALLRGSVDQVDVAKTKSRGKTGKLNKNMLGTKGIKNYFTQNISKQTALDTIKASKDTALDTMKASKDIVLLTSKPDIVSASNIVIDLEEDIEFVDSHLVNTKDIIDDKVHLKSNGEVQLENADQRFEILDSAFDFECRRGSHPNVKSPPSEVELEGLLKALTSPLYDISNLLPYLAVKQKSRRRNKSSNERKIECRTSHLRAGPSPSGSSSATPKLHHDVHDLLDCQNSFATSFTLGGTKNGVVELPVNLLTSTPIVKQKLFGINFPDFTPLNSISNRLTDSVLKDQKKRKINEISVNKVPCDNFPKGSSDKVNFELSMDDDIFTDIDLDSLLRSDMIKSSESNQDGLSKQNVAVHAQVGKPPCEGRRLLTVTQAIQLVNESSQMMNDSQRFSDNTGADRRKKIVKNLSKLFKKSPKLIQPEKLVDDLWFHSRKAGKIKSPLLNHERRLFKLNNGLDLDEASDGDLEGDPATSEEKTREMVGRVNDLAVPLCLSQKEERRSDKIGKEDFLDVSDDIFNDLDAILELERDFENKRKVSRGSNPSVSHCSIKKGNDGEDESPNVMRRRKVCRRLVDSESENSILTKSKSEENRSLSDDDFEDFCQPQFRKGPPVEQLSIKNGPPVEQLSIKNGPPVEQLSIKKKIKRKKDGNRFIDFEAEVSADPLMRVSSDESESSLDHYDHSFVDDDTQQIYDNVDMRALYLQSVRSPGQRPCEEPVVTGIGHMQSHSTSFVDSNSEDDSFVVANDVIEYDTEYAGDTMLAVDPILDNPLPSEPGRDSDEDVRNPRKRRRIAVPSSSDEESSPQKTRLEPPDYKGQESSPQKTRLEPPDYKGQESSPQKTRLEPPDYKGQESSPKKTRLELPDYKGQESSPKKTRLEYKGKDSPTREEPETSRVKSDFEKETESALPNFDIRFSDDDEDMLEMPPSRTAKMPASGMSSPPCKQGRQRFRSAKYAFSPSSADAFVDDKPGGRTFTSPKFVSKRNMLIGSILPPSSVLSTSASVVPKISPSLKLPNVGNKEESLFKPDAQGTNQSEPSSERTSASGRRDTKTEACVLVDSSEITMAGLISSTLRLKYGAQTYITQLNPASYVVSCRMAVYRISFLAFASSSNRQKLVATVRTLLEMYERPVIIVEKGRKTSWKTDLRTFYLDTICCAFAQVPSLKVLYSDDEDGTAETIWQLWTSEKLKGHKIPTFSGDSLHLHQVIRFYKAVPRVTCASAICLAVNFRSVREAVNSTSATLIEKGKMTSQLTTSFLSHFSRLFRKDMMPISRLQQEIL